MAVLFPPLKGVVILNRLKCNILNIVITIKLSYRDMSKYRTYCTQAYIVLTFCNFLPSSVTVAIRTSLLSSESEV